MDFPDHEHVDSNITVAQLAQAWLRHLRAERRLENTTINECERVLNKLVVPNSGACNSVSSPPAASMRSWTTWQRRA